MRTPSQEQLIGIAEQNAINRVAERQGRINDIADEQKKSMQELLEGQIQGSAGAAEMGELPNMDFINAKIEKQAKERESRFEDNVRVAALPGNVVGMEQDGDRSITIDASLVRVESDKDQVQEVNDHEFEHTLQASDSDALDIPETGDTQIDGMLAISHMAYRERGAMEAAGDTFTSAQYHRDYKEPVNRVAAYLNNNGENGEQLVEDAARKGKMAAVQRTILQIHFKNQIEQALNN
ncbi:MAG: hypothetical protein JWM56_986 [Candidatus Peribacteria bacterium]|nr:hypothetical protein [Candidatus Peribacteria bacterium]